jgi:5-methylcytosine-specific restriction protein A
MDAFAEYDREGPRDGYGDPKQYWVKNPDNGFLYPQKMIYGMATGLDQRECPSATDTRKALEKLAFKIFDTSLAQDAEAKFQKGVEASLRSKQTDRKARLKEARKLPATIVREVLTYQRNPDVIAERLSIAQGVCEDCKQDAPFLRASTREPFLEVHHIKPLSDGGPDTVENTTALCPNCHRKAHYG